MYICEATSAEEAVIKAVGMPDLEIYSNDFFVEKASYIVNTNYGKLFCEYIYDPNSAALDPLPVFVRVSTFNPPVDS